MISLRCPLCHTLLVANAAGVSCSNRHQFDRAREGYLNLLPVHHKSSKEPGDSREQLQARRDFLQAGFYNPLRDAFLALLPAGADNLLDIGCGEGFFTQALAQQLQAPVLGLDIAKAGVRLAARHAQLAQQQGASAQPQYAVASSFALPVMDASVAMITRVFAPSQPAELQRVLRPEGWLLLAVPAAEHLLGLRQHIYSEVRPHVLPPAPAGFILREQTEVRAPLALAGESLRALLGMTPFAWRLRPEQIQHLLEQGHSDVLHVAFLLYQKIAD